MLIGQKKIKSPSIKSTIFLFWEHVDTIFFCGQVDKICAEELEFSLKRYSFKFRNLLPPFVRNWYGFLFSEIVGDRYNFAFCKHVACVCIF